MSAGTAPPSSETAVLVSGPELAEYAAEPYSTIDHWADFGLLVFAYRGRRRVFDRALNLARCARIRALQEKGMNLAAIRALLEEDDK